MANNLLNLDFDEPLDGATSASIDIQVGDGNLSVGALPIEEQTLARGSLQYFEKQGRPARSLESCNGQACFSLKAGESGRPWFHLPWTACNGATLWQVMLNSTLPTNINAHSGGGNVKLDLRGTAVRRVTAGTGGGNLDMTLPEEADALEAAAETGAGNVDIGVSGGLKGNSTLQAKSGAGNVTVSLPKAVEARIHASTGMGKVYIDPFFSKVGDRTYQSPGFENAADRLEITAGSGAGNVRVEVREA